MSNKHLPNGVAWTPDEDDVVRRLYAQGCNAVRAQLPHRSIYSIRHRAVVVGVAKNTDWTARDDRRLLYMWGDGKMGIDAIAAELGRRPAAVYRRAHKLGLAVGCPPGFEYVANAAKRCNYDDDTMRKILEWAEVKIHPALSDPNLPRGKKYRRGYVDPEHVDQAVHRWLKTETLRGAAIARGMTYARLYRRLADAGLVQPKTNNTAWRIPSAEIDRVLAEHASENRSAA